MTRSYGRSKKGERVYDCRPYERGTNITTIGAISLSGFQGIKIGSTRLLQILLVVMTSE